MTKNQLATRTYYIAEEEQDALCHSYLGSTDVAGRMGLFGQPEHCGRRGDDERSEGVAE